MKRLFLSLAMIVSMVSCAFAQTPIDQQLQAILTQVQTCQADSALVTSDGTTTTAAQAAVTQAQATLTQAQQTQAADTAKENTDLDQLKTLVDALMDQSKKPTKATQKKRLTGAKPTPRHILMAAPRFKASTPTPVQFSAIPPKLSMWLNDTYGDCVTAEEAFAKASYSVANGQPELFATDQEVYNLAVADGGLNGQNLPPVMDFMAATGMSISGSNYRDGPYTAIDWTSSASLCNAISIGPVKIGVAAGQLQGAVGNSNGWLGLNFSPDNNEDHCVSLCGYGTLAYCCSMCGVQVPAGQDPNQLCYELYTWSTVGIVNQSSLNAICGEAWLRNPTTVVGGPTPPTPPTPPKPRH